MYLLFHREECPYCLKVRQYMSENDINYISVVSSPKSPNRQLLEKLGGKQQVPFLVDLKNGISMYESTDIINYLKKLN